MRKQVEMLSARILRGEVNPQQAALLVQTLSTSEMIDVHVKLFTRALGLEDFGFVKFNMTESLAAALVLTDTKGLTGKDFSLPFPSFELQLPAPILHITALRDSNAPFAVRRMIVTRRQTITPEAARDFNAKIATQQSQSFNLGPPEEYKRVIDKTLFQGEPDRSRDWLEIILISEVDPAKAIVYDAMVENFFPNPDQEIGDWLAACELDMDEKFRAVTEPLSATDRAAFPLAMRLIVNFCAYAMTRCSIRRAGNSYEIEGDIGRSSLASKPQWLIGKAVKLPSQLLQAALQEQQGKGSTGLKLQHRHVVRGHWKGRTGRAGEKDIFIQPYWRGPEHGDAMTRVYDAATLTERNQTH
jgi:hypothetical protein